MFSSFIPEAGIRRAEHLILLLPFLLNFSYIKNDSSGCMKFIRADRGMMSHTLTRLIWEDVLLCASRVLAEKANNFVSRARVVRDKYLPACRIKTRVLHDEYRLKQRRETR